MKVPQVLESVGSGLLIKGSYEHAQPPVGRGIPRSATSSDSLPVVKQYLLDGIHRLSNIAARFHVPGPTGKQTRKFVNQGMARAGGWVGIIGFLIQPSVFTSVVQRVNKQEIL